MKKTSTNTSSRSMAPLWWTLLVISFLGLIAALGAFPDQRWAQGGAALVLLISLIFLLVENRKKLRGRAASFGMHSVLTVLIVISIVGVLNFLGSKYPKKLDLTKNRIHTLSDQSVKAVKSIQNPVKAVFYGKQPSQEKMKPLFRNYQEANPKFTYELMDPDKDLARFRAAGLTRADSAILTMGEKTSKLDEVNEEKLTNALIKLGKEKKRLVCSIIGHGEKSFKDEKASGLETLRKELEFQYYDFREVPLAQEGKIPAECDAVAIMGANRAPLEGEMKILDAYAANGGRLLVALDVDVARGEESQQALLGVLAKWNIASKHALILDEVSKLLGVSPTVPVIATYSSDHAITKDFNASNNCLFPITRPLEILPDPPASLNVTWLAKSTPKSFGETSFKELKSQSASFNPGQDVVGPMTVAIAAEGKLKDSKAEKATRIVVFGTSLFAVNQFITIGSNKDFVLNSISWLMEDESLISIRTREDEAGKIELTQSMGWLILMATVIVVPLLISIFGIVYWVRRKKL